MTADPGPNPGQPEEGRPEDEQQRRRRRAEVFGDVLPEGTGDERGDGWSEREPAREATEEWLRRQVPPHHG